jgi:hypothetical protein
MDRHRSPPQQKSLGKRNAKRAVFTHMNAKLIQRYIAKAKHGALNSLILRERFSPITQHGNAWAQFLTKARAQPLSSYDRPK